MTVITEIIRSSLGIGFVGKFLEKGSFKIGEGVAVRFWIHDWLGWVLCILTNLCYLGCCPTSSFNDCYLGEGILWLGMYPLGGLYILVRCQF